jgi:hypothetical protein
MNHSKGDERDGDERDGDERGFEERSRQLFAESVAGLDGSTRSRLRQARASAVASVTRRRRFWFDPVRLAPAGVAAAAILAVAVMWSGPETVVEPVESSVLSDLDILLDEEELDLFEELEFYAWLLEQPEILEGDGSG